MADDRFEKERQFAALTFEKRGLAKRTKEINGELADLQEEILEAWSGEGVRGVPLTNATLSLKKGGFVKIARQGDEATAEEKAAAAQALKDAGYGEYVTEGFNSRSVSSLAKDEHWDRDLPEELEGKLSFEPKYEIQVRAKKSKEDDGAPEELPASSSS